MFGKDLIDLIDLVSSSPSTPTTTTSAYENTATVEIRAFFWRRRVNSKTSRWKSTAKKSLGYEILAYSRVLILKSSLRSRSSNLRYKKNATKRSKLAFSLVGYHDRTISTEKSGESKGPTVMLFIAPGGAGKSIVRYHLSSPCNFHRCRDPSGEW